ncbi:hypothetical protein JAAARDRAFT_193547 [Jaapia argillacea MUCL 33604]|uniref:Uncharacterized protein n=1 Tax=Jaapia argillacea MUCL 33604 TaxID=933084 RepID=A0A067PW29_9AGAM|nr:hypothetical protein JAAARDRAFT_193547 [Jaapia argillacea MUCL 33604]
MLNSLLLQTNITSTPSSHPFVRHLGNLMKDFIGSGPYPTYALPPHPSEQPTRSFKSNAVSIPVIPIPIQKSPPKPVQNLLPPPPVPVKVTHDPRHAMNLFTIVARHVVITSRTT